MAELPDTTAGMAQKHDVLIVGAGPAGSAAAISLASLGFKVAIVEMARFPRAHVGICISDQTFALIDALGIGPAVRRAGLWPRNETAVKWGGTETRLVPQPGLHVDRAVLDGLLLDRAREAGVS